MVLTRYDCDRSYEAKQSVMIVVMSELFYESKFYVSVFRMLIPKKNRIAIYEYLFKEGVMVAKKDDNAPKHPSIEGVTNLQAVKAAQVCNGNLRG